jgi:hypothetical protein
MDGAMRINELKILNSRKEISNYESDSLSSPAFGAMVGVGSLGKLAGRVELVL